MVSMRLISSTRPRLTRTVLCPHTTHRAQARLVHLGALRGVGAQGLVLQEWGKARTDWITLRADSDAGGRSVSPSSAGLVTAFQCPPWVPIFGTDMTKWR